MMAGPIAKEISDDYGVDPKRSASMLDIYTSVGQGLIPYGAQLLSAATLTALTPFEIIPYLDISRAHGRMRVPFHLPEAEQRVTKSFFHEDGSDMKGDVRLRERYQLCYNSEQ